MKENQKMAPNMVLVKNLVSSFCPVRRVLFGTNCWFRIKPDEQARRSPVLLCRMLMFMGREIHVILKLVDTLLMFDDIF